MKSKLRWLLLLVPLALFAWAYKAASWRPKLVGIESPAVSKWPMSQGQLLISPDGTRLVSSGVRREQMTPTRAMTVWALASSQTLWQQKPVAIGWMKPLAFSPDSRLLAVSSDWDAFGRPNCVVDILDAASGKLERRIASFDAREIQRAAFLSNRAFVIATSKGVAVMDTKSGKVIRQWKFRAVAFVGGKRVYAPQSDISANGTTILALANGKDVSIYNSTTGKKTGKWTLKGAHVNPCLSPDGKLWAIQQEDVGLFEVYDANTGNKLYQFAGDNNYQLWGWSADSQQIMSSSGAFMVLSQARTGRDSRQLPGTRNTQALALDPRGDYFYTLDDKGKIWRWRLR